MGVPDTRTVAALARDLRSGATTAETAVEACLDAIAAQDAAMHAFISVREVEARAEARAADRAHAQGRILGPLHGVPLSVKDLIDIDGMPTTAASRVRRDHRAQADACIIERLRGAGAIVVGKTNLHEFALGTTNEDSAYGAVHHPLDSARSPGGSSGGSAASVLAGMAYASIGTDTGGSIRIPSSCCGLVGLKPAVGDVPVAGVVPLSPTLDHVGPLCRSVADAALLFDVLRGAPIAPLEALAPAGLRVGVLGGYFAAVLDSAVAEAFQAACARLRDAGAVLEPVDIPHAADIPAIYLHIVLAEAAAYHARTLDTRGDEYTAPVRARLELGRYVLGEDYVRALRGRDVLRREVDTALGGRRALLLPTLPIPAPLLGIPMVAVGATHHPVREITLRLTQLFNITGHPAITIPCGRTVGGLPIGAQLVGPAGSTRALLETASALAPHIGPGGRG